MPGVPSGRGCDGCRKQKKKIPCLGQGQQRYKFKNETVVTTTVAKRVITTSFSVDNPQFIVPTPCKAISNGPSKLVSAFVGRISQGVDIRFQLPWNFGDYLNQLPRRLGVSEALDAAVDALTTVHASFCAGNLSPGPEVLAKHAHSLSVLRRDLSDAVKARASETLAAIMVFEALLADTIHLTSREWKILNAGAPENFHKYLDGQWFTCIANVPDLIQRSKAALILYEPPSTNLLALELEVVTLLDELKPIISRIRDRSNTFDKTAVPVALSDHLQAHYLRSLALALGVGIILNCVLSGLEGTPTIICEESTLWSDEIVQVAEICLMYRPLGSMSILIALQMAWAGAVQLESKERIESLLVEYAACVGLTEKSECGDLGQMRRRWTLEQL
ncbi:MAG: hypothetical protein Q9168_003146 [Polycauliona sp. 1 TL-2023]